MARQAPIKRRALFPMPVTALIDSPTFLAMPAAGAGIVIRLALHFWQTDCRPLPIADHELRNVSRAHSPTWRHWKREALAVFEEIRPELERYRQTRLTKATTIRFASRNGGAATQANARRARLEEATPAPVTPVTLPRHDPTQHTPPRRPATPQRSQARLQDR